ncbi:MAG: hypothetical protein OEN50_20985 [Deltaproteobacteria bacterium]|nr:hypothetical protein [Deltaproteobacteria bacterium]
MKPLISRLKSRQGITFNEILVAMAITGIGVLGYAATTVGVIRGNHASGNHTVAVNLAHEKLEQLKGATNLVSENRCPGAGESGLNALGAAGGIFDRCWTITDTPLAAGLKQIEVTVTWRESGSGAVTLSTLVYKD